MPMISDSGWILWVKYVPDRSHITVLKVNTFGKQAELY